MAENSTQTLHERADRAASDGDFTKALTLAAEALRVAPLDPKARVKVALCLAMLGKGQSAVAALRILAVSQARRGYVLSAIGACRDALGMSPGDPDIHAVLREIHAQIQGQEGRVRVPPPTPPATVDESAEGSFLAMPEDARVAAAEALALEDPTEGESPAPAGRVPLFSDLSEDVFVELVERMGYLKVGPDHTVVKQLEAGTSLFILLSGEVKVSKSADDGEERELARLGSGSLFGEMSLITAKPRSATVTTTQPSELFEIDRRAVDEVVREHASIRDELVEFARRRLLMNLMATSRIFQPFDHAQRLELLRAFRSVVVEPQTPIIQDDAEPDGLYVVLEGEVEVSKIDTSGDAVVLAYLREGEVFGEIALVERRKTTARVTATEKSVLLLLEKERFDEVTRAHPEVLEVLSTLSGARREETEEAMAAEGLILDADDLIIL